MSDETRESDQLAGVRLPEQTRALVGHASVWAGLEELIGAARLPNAIMFHGPRGIGKATTAFLAARRIFAATGDETEGHIEAQLEAGAYPNLFVLRKMRRVSTGRFKTEITVDQVRRSKANDRDTEPNPLRDRLHQTRGRAGQRVVIIDSVDDCNDTSANALLKMMEEPPPETTFLLISHRPGQLLPTIRSRCHMVALRPLPHDEVVAVVAEQAGAGDATERAARLAGGRPRRGFEALALSDDGPLGALEAWLSDPLAQPVEAHLGLADRLGGNREGAEFAFAQDLVRDWLAAAGRSAAEARDMRQLASATGLWEKADALFADTAELNLDGRQTLVTAFDAIRRHLQRTDPVGQPR